MRYKLSLLKQLINYIFLDRIMVKKEKTQIRNIKNEKVKYSTDVTMLKR